MKPNAHLSPVRRNWRATDEEEMFTHSSAADTHEANECVMSV